MIDCGINYAKCDCDWQECKTILILSTNQWFYMPRILKTVLKNHIKS